MTNLNRAEVKYILDIVYIQSYEKDLYREIRAWFSVPQNIRNLLDSRINLSAEMYFDARDEKHFISNVFISCQIKEKNSVLYLPFYFRQN